MKPIRSLPKTSVPDRVRRWAAKPVGCGVCGATRRAVAKAVDVVARTKPSARK